MFLCFDVTDQILAPKVMVNFIKIHLEQNGIDSCNIKTRRGNLCQVCLSGQTTGLQIMMVNELFPHFFMNGQQSHISVMQNFDAISQNLKSHIEVDVTTGLVSSSGHLAKLFFDNEIKYGRCFTMISPSNHLNNLLLASCRYGILQAMTETVIHPFYHYKSFFSMDFSKHYLNILKNLCPLYGHPMHFERDGLVFNLKSKHLKHHTFANVMFHAISKCTNSNIVYNLVGKEAQIDCLRIDA